MREMTSAEFTRVNLTKLDAPVTIKRYTKIIGAYYPAAFEPADAPISIHPPEFYEKDARDKIEALEVEVKRLKQLLAQRDMPNMLAKPVLTNAIAGEGSGRGVRPLARLRSQDRDFLARKLEEKK